MNGKSVMFYFPQSRKVRKKNKVPTGILPVPFSDNNAVFPLRSLRLCATFFLWFNSIS
jgi:hypothetical protein